MSCYLNFLRKGAYPTTHLFVESETLTYVPVLTRTNSSGIRMITVRRYTHGRVMRAQMVIHVQLLSSVIDLQNTMDCTIVVLTLVMNDDGWD